jgi:hypothetical protein
MSARRDGGFTTASALWLVTVALRGRNATTATQNPYQSQMGDVTKASTT